GSGTVYPARTAPPSPTLTSWRFICGEPMKPATKTLAGFVAVATAGECNQGEERLRGRRATLSRSKGVKFMLRLLAVPLSVLAFHTSVTPLPAHVRGELTGRFWHKGCPASLSQLRV